MSAKSLGFIGGGRVARILLGGLAKAGKMPATIVVSDPDGAALEKLKRAHPAIERAAGGNARAAAQDVVFLAVHPPLVKEALDQARGALKPSALVASLAPKLTIAKIKEMLGGFDRIVRMIPNAPSIVGAGYNPVAFSASLGAEDRASWLELAKAWGDCPVVAEEKLEAYAIVTAMGPTYFWFQLFELQALGESFGLTAEEAREGLAKMLAGACQTMARSGLSPAEVQDLIPVRPLAGAEPSITEAYRTSLRGVFEKIRP